jgi:hypothetical protein
MSYTQKAQELYTMIGSGQLLDAFEKFYSEDVVMQEMGEEPRVGKAINREFELKFIGSVETIHGGGVNHITADETNGVVMVENWMDLTFKGGPRVRLEQVCVQEWDGEQIVKERFYHR